VFNPQSKRRPSGGEVQRFVQDFAQLNGWLCHYTNPVASRNLDGYSDGFPTSVLVKDGRLVIVTVGRQLTPPQQRWAEELANVPAVQMLVLPGSELGHLTATLRVAPPRPAEPPQEDARPRQRSGRQKQSSQASSLTARRSGKRPA